jgi:hypothetical protein
MIAGLAAAGALAQPCDPDELCIGGPGFGMAAAAMFTGPVWLIGAIVAGRGGGLRRSAERRLSVAPWLSPGGGGLGLRLALEGADGVARRKDSLAVEALGMEMRGQRLRRAGWTVFGTSSFVFSTVGLALAVAPCDSYCEDYGGRSAGWAVDILLVGPTILVGAILAARGHGLRRRARGAAQSSAVEGRFTDDRIGSRPERATPSLAQ